MTPPLLRPALVAGLTLGALSPVAGAAAAPTITVDRPCYVNTNTSVGAPMTITGRGFIPGDTIDVSGGGAHVTAPVGADGGFVASTPAPVLRHSGPGTATTTVLAQDATNPAAPTASTVVRSANLAVATRPDSVLNLRRDRVTYQFSGFTPGRHIYGYWARGRKVLARTRFGRAVGPCGTLRQRALLYPGGRPRYERYSLTFENVSHYSRTAFPRVTGLLSILHY